MFQNDAIDWDLDIVINQGQGKVDEDWHLVEDGKKHRERSPQGEVDDRKEDNEFPIPGYPFHSAPTRIDEKQFSGEIPRWRTV